MIQGFFILQIWQSIFDLATGVTFTSTFILKRVAGGCILCPDVE